MILFAIICLIACPILAVAWALFDGTCKSIWKRDAQEVIADTFFALFFIGLYFVLPVWGLLWILRKLDAYFYS